MHKLSKLVLAALIAVAAVSCSDDPKFSEPEGVKVEGAQASNGGAYTGFYVLNEGNMGSGNCTLDYFSYLNGTYTHDIYSTANPDRILGLGDTGNDMAAYEDMLFIVINGSNKVEVLDAATAKYIGEVAIDSPRYIAFYGNLAFVSSYSGDNGFGSVVAFDIYSRKIMGKVAVGKDPEAMAVLGKSLYVANSGDYTKPGWYNTISVVDIMSLMVTGNIDAPINLQHITFDAYHNLWASSRGNYADKPSCLAHFAPTGNEKSYMETGTIDKPVTNMALGKDRLLFIGCEYDANWNATYSYNTVDLTSNSYRLGSSFITDGSGLKIKTPYGLFVNPSSGEIYLTDVKDYVSDGEVLCFSKDGKLLWKTTAGQIPGHIAFYRK